MRATGWDKGELTHDGLGFDLQVTVCRRQWSSLALKYRLGGNNNKKKSCCQLHQHIHWACLSPHASSQLPAIFLPPSTARLSTSPTLWFHFLQSPPSASVDSHLLLLSWLLRRACLVQKNSRIPVSKHACGVIIACNVASETRLRGWAFSLSFFLSKCLRILR